MKILTLANQYLTCGFYHQEEIVKNIEAAGGQAS